MIRINRHITQALTLDVTPIRTRNQCSLKLLFASILNKLSALPAAGREEQTTATPAAGQVVKVVLADDDPDDRELFAEVIAAIDPRIQVTTYCDCDSLIQELAAANGALPDIVFLDLNMPGKNGKQCLAEIKNNARYQQLPVVIYSTSTLIRDVQETQKIGADLFLRKPSSFNDTLELVRKVFTIDFSRFNTPGYSGEFVLAANNNHF